MGLIERLPEGLVALDTAVFIYLIEEHPTYLPLVLPLFEAIHRGERSVVTSAVTLLEVLVVPYRTGDLALANRYEAILSRSRGVELVEVSVEQLRAAAALRAKHGVRTPDALQLSAALTTECSAFITNDRRHPKLAGLEIVQLASVLP